MHFMFEAVRQKIVQCCQSAKQAGNSVSILSISVLKLDILASYIKKVYLIPFHQDK